jgi:nickel-dependent lactate racemase
MRERAPKLLRGPVPRNKEDDQVVYIDGDSAPRILFSGEDLLLEDLPIGTRVLYPKPPIEGLVNPGAAIRYALNHPLEAEPLYAQLAPGMKVTIAVDDISLPLPPMTTPDIRQTIIEILLEQLDANGVDDVHIVIANSLHRRLSEAEMKRMVGAKIHNAFYPDRYYNHDAEDPDGIVKLGETAHGEPVLINRRAVESDLVIYVNINCVPMDGGHKSVTVGLADYQSVRPHHDPETMRSISVNSSSFLDRNAVAPANMRLLSAVSM